MTANDEKSNAECEAAIRRFAEITNTDEALAHFYLQDFNFDVDTALTAFYSEQAQVVGTSNQLDESNSEKSDKKSDTEEDEEDVSSVSRPKRAKTDESYRKIPPELTVVSWNIDGIDKDALHTRFSAVLTIIAKINPEIIFFQEFVHELFPKLQEVMGKMYTILVGNEGFAYYVVTLVSKNIKVERYQDIQFSTTGMGRTMLVVEAKCGDLKIKLINTHLESMKHYATTRKAQFNECTTKMSEFMNENDQKTTLTIFGGDLNIRDTEISALPPRVHDAWVKAGSDNLQKYTWDQSKNDNHTGWKKARCRFDRLYFNGPYESLNFDLHGTQRIKQSLVFPSDHFAICCRFYNPM